MIVGSIILGVLLGAFAQVARIVYRWWFGQPTVVTAGGWPVDPIRSAGWGVVIGAFVALIEVLRGRKVLETWGFAGVLSSIGGLVGGLLTWKVWTAFSSPVLPTASATLGEVKP